MATLLLITIYLSFISLGIPDSLFGAAWPAIYAEMQLPVSYANFVTLTCSACTCLSSILSARVINRFGTGRVTAASILMTACALMGISCSGHLTFLVLLAIPLGLGGGAVDSGLNNYVALHYNARQMNFLHCFYGVGVSISPYILSLALSGTGGWRGGYRMMSLIQFGIAAVVLLTLPLWNRTHAADGTPVEEEPQITLSLRAMLRIKGLPLMWLMFAAACAIEVTCGAWGSTFLVEHKRMAVDLAAKVVTCFYVGMALGRFASGLLSARLLSSQLVILSQVVIGIALLLLMLPLGGFAAAAGLFLTGFGIGPIFPGLMHLTPVLFGRSSSQSIIGTQMAAAYIGIMGLPALFGILAQHFGAGLYPYYMAIFFVILAGSTACAHLIRREKNA